MKTAIICCARREELYLIDWIEYHLNLGIDHIFIADNNDVEQINIVPELLKKYIDNGSVSVFNYTQILPVQMRCYNDLYQKYKNEYDWFTFIDVDEYISLQQHQDIKQFLNAYDESVKSILMYWQQYDDNNLIHYENISPVKRFIQPCTYYANWNRNGEIIDIETVVPRTKAFLRGNLDIQISETNSPHTILSRQDLTKFKQIIPYTSDQHSSNYERIIDSYKLIKLNHYRYMTIEEFLNKRFLRCQDCYRTTIENKNKQNFCFEAFWTINKKTVEKLHFLSLWLNKNIINKDKWFEKLEKWIFNEINRLHNLEKQQQHIIQSEQKQNIQKNIQNTQTIQTTQNINIFENSFVISIDDKKYNNFCKIFQYQNITPLPNLWSGVTLKRSLRKGVQNEIDNNPYLFKTISCSISHLSIVKLAKFLDLPFVLIFEDDAYPCIDIVNKLHFYLNNIPENCKCLVLGYYFCKECNQYNDLFYILSSQIKWWGAHAYIVFKSGYDEYINAYNNNDFVADHVFLTMSDSYATIENLIIQYNFIESMSVEKTGYLWKYQSIDTILQYFPNLNDIHAKYHLDYLN